MEEEEGNVTPPFWLQTSNKRRGGRRGGGFKNLLSSGVLLIFLLGIAFALVFIIVPSFLKFTSQVFRPQSIKKSWDSVNLVLVLFAVVCGFLSRNVNNNNETPTASPTSYYQDQNMSNNEQKTPSYALTSQHKWFDDQYPDRARMFYNNHGTATLNRLRSFSSHPDLRSVWAIDDDGRWRFYDDTHLNNSNNNYRGSSSSYAEKQELQEEEDTNVDVMSNKDIKVDTAVTPQEEAPPSAPTPPSPPPSPPVASKVVKRKVKRTYHDLGKTKKNEIMEVRTYYMPPPSPPPPPPPPPPTPPRTATTKKRGKDNFLNSLRRRKKKQRQRSVENFESLFDPLRHFSSTPATTSLLPPPSPPPPAPPTTRQRPLEADESRTKSMVPQVTVHEPPKPVALTSIEEPNVDSGNSSPQIPIPPPPPPPPFKMAAWKFVQEGDYVRVASFNGSDMDSSEELNSDRESSPCTPMEVDKSGSTSNGGALFCPSPDVNTKADNFIARFKAGLRLEKMNSVKGRRS